jgi:hypothetical protein
MQNTKTRKQEFVSVGHPLLDSKLGGGLRPGRVTELVGPADQTHPIAFACMSEAIRGGQLVSAIDFVHELQMDVSSLLGLTIVQPEKMRDLSKVVGKLAFPGMDLIVLFLGDEISFHDGKPRCQIDWEADLCLRQIRWSLASAGTACLAVTDYPVMPDGPTVVRALPGRFAPNEAHFEVIHSLECEFSFLS